MNITKPKSDAEFVLMYSNWRKFVAAIEEMDDASPVPAEIHPDLWQMQRDALVSVTDDFKTALDDYARDQEQLIRREQPKIAT